MGRSWRAFSVGGQPPPPQGWPAKGGNAQWRTANHRRDFFCRQVRGWDASRSSFTANQGLVCPARESPPSCPGRAPSSRRYRIPFLQSILTERKKRERKKVKN